MCIRDRGLIEQAFRPVAEIAGQQFRNQAGMGDVRHRQQHPSIRGEQVGQLREQIAGSAQMLQDVGADNEIVPAAGEVIGQGDPFEIGAFQAAIPGRGFGDSGGIVLDTIHHATQRFGQVAAEHPRTRAQIQHPAARPHRASELGQRILTVRVQGAMINVGGGRDGQACSSWVVSQHTERAPAEYDAL